MSTVKPDVTLPCPCCAMEDAVHVWVDPGEPDRGPSYASGGEPRVPASVDDVEYECECYESGVVDTDKYDQAIHEAVFS